MVILWLIGTITHVSAQPKADFSVSPKDNSLLFKISGKGIKKNSYIFGTIHAGCESELNFSDKFFEAFKKSKQLYLEVDIDNIGELLTAQVNLLLPSDSSLSHLLNPQEYERVKRFFQDTLKKDFEKYESIRPILLTGVLYPNPMNCSKPIGFEQILKRMAKIQGKPIYGLEKVTAQVSAFDKIPLRLQAQALLTAIRFYDPMKIRETYQQMYHYYWSNNLILFTELIMEDERINYNTKGFEQVLVFDRNKKWLPVIIQGAKQEPSFFAFGAAHLVGKEGIIQLLRKEGYKVEAVRW